MKTAVNAETVKIAIYVVAVNIHITTNDKYNILEELNDTKKNT